MIAFKVFKNGKQVAISGIHAHDVVNCVDVTLISKKRKSSDIFLGVHGSKFENEKQISYRWIGPCYELQVGDQIIIEVIESNKVDKAKRERVKK